MKTFGYNRACKYRLFVLNKGVKAKCKGNYFYYGSDDEGRFSKTLTCDDGGKTLLCFHFQNMFRYCCKALSHGGLFAYRLKLIINNYFTTRTMFSLLCFLQVKKEMVSCLK